MSKKKIFYYDKDQYIDAEGNLLFFNKKVKLIVPGKEDVFGFFFLDSLNEEVAFLDISHLTKVEDTYNRVVELVCEFYDWGHKNPKGFSVTTRTEAIHFCISHCYKNVNTKSKPNQPIIADIFGITLFSLMKMEKKYNTSHLKNTELANFVSHTLNKQAVLVA